jgi:hypothetical protein
MKMSISILPIESYECHGVKEPDVICIRRVYLSTKLLYTQILGIGVTAIFS